MMTLKNKKLAFLLTSFLFASSFACAKISDAEAKALLQKAEDSTAFYETDFTGSYEIVQDKPGEGRSKTNATIYRRDSTSKWTILINAPLKDKGKGYLQTDNSIWFYDPADRRFTFSSSRDRFQGTNANTSDFAPMKFVRDYKIESATEVKLGKFDCVLYTLKATSKKVDYPMLKLWVSKDGLMRKKEDYSLSGQKLRTTAVPSYQTISSSNTTHQVPVSMVIQDNLQGKKINGKMEYEKTLISISNVSLEKQDDAVYTKPYLELMSVK
ncbi:outer membrane lipoprotein-sorting protein [Treponema zioleckii]|uniref:outer membrane lipoprotein-sorting protein n=1 Tax=Treponema zioleckii TaxID=331680 RepID=UPI001F5BF5FF|nr:outer membrane lipoprotein-sorting protein [Treponema zioleckii]